MLYFNCPLNCTCQQLNWLVIVILINLANMFWIFSWIRNWGFWRWSTSKYITLLYTSKYKVQKNLLLIASNVPVDTGHKQNVHETFRKRPGRLLNILCTFSLHPVSTGVVKVHHQNAPVICSHAPARVHSNPALLYQISTYIKTYKFFSHLFFHGASRDYIC